MSRVFSTVPGLSRRHRTRALQPLRLFDSLLCFCMHTHFLSIGLVIYLSANLFFEYMLDGSGAGNMHVAARCRVRFN